MRLRSVQRFRSVYDRSRYLGAHRMLAAVTGEIHRGHLRTFSKGDGGENHGQNRVSRQLRESVVFLQLNLMDAWPTRRTSGQTC